MALSIAESGIVETAVYDLMGRSQFPMLPENGIIKESLKKQFKGWKSRSTHRLSKVAQGDVLQQELMLYQQVIYLDVEQFYSQLSGLLHTLQEQNSVFADKASKLIARSGHEKGSLFPRYFCKQWYEELSSAILRTQVEILETEKERFLQEFYQKLETFKQVGNITEIGDHSQSGRFWDMAAAKLTKGNIQQIKRYAAFLKQHDEIKAIVDKLGRMAGEVADSQPEQALVQEPKVIEQHSDEATDDIVGIYQNNDLSRMIPNEAIFLTSPELETVFYKRFADKRLMNYQMQGKSRTITKIHSKKPDYKKPDQDKGPFIVCVDASGFYAGVFLSNVLKLLPTLLCKQLWSKTEIAM